MKNANKIAHPAFLACVLALILNDWYWKAAFHNNFTGKLSDFAGLFAFPYLLSVLSPGNSRKIHVLTALLFVFWKSEYAQPVIDFINHLGIPVYRTVDFTDNIALLSVPFSYFALSRKINFTLPPLLQRAVIAISCLAFMATSLPPRENRKFTNIEKEYRFDFSRRELISRLNMIQMEEITELHKLNGEIDFDSETNIFHYHDKTDTLAHILDYEKVQDRDTIVFKTSFAEITITGDDQTAALKLLTVYKNVPVHKDEDYRKKAVKQFENRIVRKIEKYR